MLAVSIGDQAGNRCCLKAELSGLRAKGPGLPFTFPMRARALASEEELDWQLETQKLRVNQPSSCLPDFYFSDISLHTHSHTPLLAKGFSQQALHRGGDRCVLLLINRNSLLNYLFLLLPIYHKIVYFCPTTHRLVQNRILYRHWLREISGWFWAPFYL